MTTASRWGKLRGASARRVCVLLFAAICAASSAAQEKKKLPPPPTDLPGHVEYLAAQLYGVPLDESEPLTHEIEKLVLDHMGEWLTVHPPDANGAGRGSQIPYDVRVRRELESVFGKLREPINAGAAAFTAPYQHDRLICLGYELGWSDYNAVSVTALYEGGDGPMRQVAVAHLVPATNLNYRLLDAPAAGQLWFLVYGTRQGKSHPRLSAVLYAFDGKTLQPLWKKLDVFDGKISFPAHRIVINYLNEDEFKRAVTTGGAVTRHEAAYHPGPKGLEVEYDH